MITWTVYDVYLSVIGWIRFSRQVVGIPGEGRRGMPWRCREWMP